MVRNRKRKTQIGLHDANDMKEAIELVEKGVPLRKAAERMNVNYGTLYRYVKKKKACSVEEAAHLQLTPNYAVNQVFSSAHETALKEYLITCSKMCYGLDTIETRKLAYEMATHHKLKMPASWEARHIAGKDWLDGFRKRNPDLTLRKPEACSLSRATSFNRHNVEIFYKNLEEVMRRCPSFGQGTRLFCLDETGTTTVQKPKRVLASKGSKQLNKVTSGERGTLVTTCCAVSATGNALPPAMVFPRKNFKSHMLKGAPTGTLGLAQTTGWMNSQLFPEVIKHFVKVTGSSKDNPSLFILDNHDSHLAPEALNIAKDNGMTLLTIPPHSSHKLQPLDVSVFGPLQTYYNAAIDSWLLRHPGTPLTIYNVAELLGQAFEKAMTPTNIKSGFMKTGIFPFDRNIFTSDDFMPSEVTNRPLQSEASLLQKNEQATNQTTVPEECLMQENEQSLNRSTTSKDFLLQQQNEQSPNQLTTSKKSEEESEQLSNQTTEPEASTSSLQQNSEKAQKLSHSLIHKKISLIERDLNQIGDILTSPIECREYPKAGPRLSKKGRKRGKSCIATDTPVKLEFEEAAKNRETKKRKKKTPSARNVEIKKKTKKYHKVVQVIFSSSEEGSGNSDEGSDVLSNSSDENDIPLFLLRRPKKDDFVVVKFSGKQTKHFIGKLLTDIEGDEYDINYLRKSGKVDNVFYFPLEPDLATVGLDDIELLLPLPKMEKKTKRQADCFSFPKKILRHFNLG